MKHRPVIMFLLACTLAIALPAKAATPDYYPETFAQWGVITEVNVERGQIRMGDITVRISPNLRVYTPQTQHESVHGLRPGMRVAMHPGGGRSPGAVSEIWVLPESYQPRRTSTGRH